MGCPQTEEPVGQGPNIRAPVISWLTSSENELQPLSKHLDLSMLPLWERNVYFAPVPALHVQVNWAQGQG